MQAKAKQAGQGQVVLQGVTYLRHTGIAAAVAATCSSTLLAHNYHWAGCLPQASPLAAQTRRGESARRTLKMPDPNARAASSQQEVARQVQPATAFHQTWASAGLAIPERRRQAIDGCAVSYYLDKGRQRGQEQQLITLVCCKQNGAHAAIRVVYNKC